MLRIVYFHMILNSRVYSWTPLLHPVCWMHTGYWRRMLTADEAAVGLIWLSVSVLVYSLLSLTLPLY